CFAGIALSLCWAILLVSGVSGDEKPKRTEPTLLGRWDFTVRTAEGEYPSWLEVRLSGYRTLVGSYVGRFGSARPLSRVDFKDSRFHFSVPPQWEQRKDDQHFEGRLEGDSLSGETTDEKGQRLTWTARRAPALQRAHAPRWGEAVELFNGKDLAG